MAENNSTTRRVAHNFIDRTGTTHGELYVIGIDHVDPKWITWWKVRCSCGVEKLMVGGHLARPDVVSCGHHKNKNTGDRSRTHGKSGSPEHWAWKHLRARCEDQSSKDWKDYGGRGITFCERWMSFENFIADVGPRPSPKHSIDRIRVNGNYEPGNVRWATPIQQGRNTRRNVRLTFNGENLCISEWAERIGAKPKSLHNRIKRGWTIEEAITRPFGAGKRNSPAPKSLFD